MDAGAILKMCYLESRGTCKSEQDSRNCAPSSSWPVTLGVDNRRNCSHQKALREKAPPKLLFPSKDC
jgi:hypothetical protein